MLPKATVNDIVLFLIIFLSCSFTICNDIWSSAVTIALWCFTAALLIPEFYGFDRKQFCIFAVMAGCMVISSVVNGENTRSWIVMLYSYVVILMYVSYVTFLEFERSFLRIMKIVCAFAFVSYCLFVLFPGLHRVFSFLRCKSATNFIICAISTKHARNMGMFWEPGALQTFTNLALLLEMSKEKVDIKAVVLYVLTIVTTYSTTGYIATLFILSMPFLKSKVRIETKLCIFFAAVVCVAVCAFSPTINTMLFAQHYEGKSTVFGKITNFLASTNDSSRSSNSSVLTSAEIRYNAVFKVFEAFLERPWWGYGYKGLAKRTYQYTHGMNTCTFLNWFATYGVVYGVFAVAGIIQFARKVASSPFFVPFVLIILFIITMSENFVTHPSIILLLFIGHSPYRPQDVPGRW